MFGATPVVLLPCFIFFSSSQHQGQSSRNQSVIEMGNSPSCSSESEMSDWGLDYSSLKELQSPITDSSSAPRLDSVDKHQQESSPSKLSKDPRSTSFLSSGSDHLNSPSITETPQRKPRPMRPAEDDATPKRSNQMMHVSPQTTILHTIGTAFDAPNLTNIPTKQPGRVTPDEEWAVQKQILRRRIGSMPTGTNEPALPQTTNFQKDLFASKKAKLYHIKFLPALKAWRENVQTTSSVPQVSLDEPVVESSHHEETHVVPANTAEMSKLSIAEDSIHEPAKQVVVVPTNKTDCAEQKLQQEHPPPVFPEDENQNAIVVYLGDHPNVTANHRHYGNCYFMEHCFQERINYWTAISNERGAQFLLQMVNDFTCHHQAMFVNAATLELMMDMDVTIGAIENVMRCLPLPDDVVILPSPTERFPDGLVSAPELFRIAANKKQKTSVVRNTIREMRTYTKIRFLLADLNDNLRFEVLDETSEFLVDWYRFFVKNKKLHGIEGREMFTE